MEWEKEAPLLASMSRNHPYVVPENYFENLAQSINQQVFLAKLSSSTNEGFSVPNTYFETLTEQIATQVALQQNNSNHDGFNVPAGYFENLQPKIVAKTSQKQTKTIRLWASDFSKYTAAACVILVSAFVLFLNQQVQIKATNAAEFANEQLLYGIDETVIVEHILDKNSASETPADLENYILTNFSTRELSNNL